MPELAPLDACSTPGCINIAAVYELFGEVRYCFDCFDLMVERWLAIEQAPALRELLPAIGDR